MPSELSRPINLTGLEAFQQTRNRLVWTELRDRVHMPVPYFGTPEHKTECRMKQVWFTGTQLYITFERCVDLLRNIYWFKKQVSNSTHNNRSCRQHVELVLSWREYPLCFFHEVSFHLQIFIFWLQLHTASHSYVTYVTYELQCNIWVIIYRVIRNDCLCFNNLSYTIHFK